MTEAQKQIAYYIHQVYRKGALATFNILRQNIQEALNNAKDDNTRAAAHEMMHWLETHEAICKDALTEANMAPMIEQFMKGHPLKETIN